MNDKTDLKKIFTYNGVFTGTYAVPRRRIISGYDYGSWIPWAIFLSGKEVQELEFLGESDASGSWNSDNENAPDTTSRELRVF